MRLTFEEIRNKLGEDAFNILKSYEALCVGHIIRHQDDLEFEGLFNGVVNGMIEKLELVTNEPTRMISRLLLDHLEFDNDYVHLLLELTGVVKCFGYPHLHPDRGFEVVRAHGIQPVNLDNDYLMNVVGTFCRELCHNYYTKYWKWPNIKECHHRVIQRCYDHKRWLTDAEERKVNNHNWSRIKFEKTFEYNYSLDTSELLKDTAIAPNYCDISQRYDHCAHMKISGFVPPQTKRAESRLIHQYIEGEEMMVLKKVKELEVGFRDENAKAAILCLKEGELNTKGRLFVKQEMRQRFAQTSMEKNLAHSILSIFPEQSMTDDELEEIKKLSAATRTMKGQTIGISLDLTKWNLKFRHETVKDFGEKFDQLFGTGLLYTDSHLWFEETVAVSNDRMCAPEFIQDFAGNFIPVPGRWCHANHLGGYEGMHQKKWTLITQMIIIQTAKQLNYNINLIGQGDNQVIILKMTEGMKMHPRYHVENLMGQLENNFRKLNLELKLEETWFSYHLLEYGRERYYKGVQISSGTKKISKLIADINDGLSSFQSGLSTISTITESLARKSQDANVAFIIYGFEYLNFLFRKDVIDIETTIDNMSALLLYPATFGGNVLSCYMAHNIRGIDDKLTIWLDIYKFVYNNHKSIWDRITAISDLSIKGTINDYEIVALVQDPFKLRCEALPSVETYMKNLVRERLPGLIHNPEVKYLITANNKSDLVTLAKGLFAMEPAIGAIMNELYRNSNIGLAEQLQARFTNVQTINKIVVHDDSEPTQY